MRGRKRRNDPPIERTISLPKSLSNVLNKHLEDPVTKKLEYGALSKLAERLFRDYLKSINLDTMLEEIHND